MTFLRPFFVFRSTRCGPSAPWPSVLLGLGLNFCRWLGSLMSTRHNPPPRNRLPSFFLQRPYVSHPIRSCASNLIYNSIQFNPMPPQMSPIPCPGGSRRATVPWPLDLILSGAAVICCRFMSAVGFAASGGLLRCCSFSMLRAGAVEIMIEERGWSAAAAASGKAGPTAASGPARVNIGHEEPGFGAPFTTPHYTPEAAPTNAW